MCQLSIVKRVREKKCVQTLNQHTISQKLTHEHTLRNSVYTYIRTGLLGWIHAKTIRLIYEYEFSRNQWSQRCIAFWLILFSFSFSLSLFRFLNFVLFIVCTYGKHSERKIYVMNVLHVIQYCVYRSIVQSWIVFFYCILLSHELSVRSLIVFRWWIFSLVCLLILVLTVRCSHTLTYRHSYTHSTLYSSLSFRVIRIPCIHVFKISQLFLDDG